METDNNIYTDLKSSFCNTFFLRFGSDGAGEPGAELAAASSSGSDSGSLLAGEALPPSPPPSTTGGGLATATSAPGSSCPGTNPREIFFRGSSKVCVKT